MVARILEDGRVCGALSSWSPHCPFVPTGQQACGVGTERENGEVFGGGQSTQIFPSYESINYFTLGPVTFQWPLANHFAWKPKR